MRRGGINMLKYGILEGMKGRCGYQIWDMGRSKERWGGYRRWSLGGSFDNWDYLLNSKS